MGCVINFLSFQNNFIMSNNNRNDSPRSLTTDNIYGGISFHMQLSSMSSDEMVYRNFDSNHIKIGPSVAAYPKVQQNSVVISSIIKVYQAASGVQHCREILINPLNIKSNDF